MILLLTEGDRRCEECGGTGVVPEEVDNGVECWEVETACDHCENGRVTEKQNRDIDLAWCNKIGRELILNARFRAAIRRRGCEGKGVGRDRFIIDCGQRFGDIVRVNVLPSGPVVEVR